MDRAFVVAGLLMSVWARPCFSQEGPRVVKMTVSPAPAAKLPIPYPLLPHFRDIKPGNAAVFYQRSQTRDWWGSARRKESDHLIETLEQPWTPEITKKFPRLDTLYDFGPLNEIAHAARSEYCDWQLLERVRADGVGLQIPDQQAMHNLGALNGVLVRFAIHQGDFDKAARGMQTNFAMARHVGEAPLLISYLVASSVTRIGQDSVEEWVQQPAAPSLYWALTDLPQPLIDWRRALQADASMIDREAPEIRKAIQAKNPQPIPVDVLRVEFKRLMEFTQGTFSPFENALAAARAEPYVRAYFSTQGLGQSEIDRFPVTQLVAMYQMAQYDRRASQILSVQNVPYWQARPLLKKWREDDAVAREKAASYNLVDSGMPAYEQIFRVRPNVERRFALLRHIEALRLYAAQHQGQWPDSLDDLRDLPLPVDPYTGKAFTYRRENKAAILEAPPPPGMTPSSSNWIRYELTLRSKPAAD